MAYRARTGAKRAAARRGGRRSPMMSGPERTALQAITEERKRGWRWHLRQETMVFGTTKPDMQGVVLDEPQAIKVQGVSPAVTYEERSTVIEIKDLQLQVTPVGATGDVFWQGFMALHRSPGEITLGTPDDKTQSLVFNPKFSWGWRPILLERGSSSSGALALGADVKARLRWKRVTVGYGNRLHLLMYQIGGNPSQGLDVQMAYLWREGGREIEVVG